jgi:hypothetical protein
MKPSDRAGILASAVALLAASSIAEAKLPYYLTCGVWMKRTLVAGRIGPGKEQAFSDALKPLGTHGFTRLFVKFTPATADGRLPRFNQTVLQDNLARIRNMSLGAQIHAWVGGPAGKSVNLGDEKQREVFAKECLRLCLDVGFDGMLFDVEPVESGDERLPAWLSAIRDAIGKDKGIALSVKPPAAADDRGAKRGWSEEYYATLSPLVDLFVVECFDTGIGRTATTPAEIRTARSNYVGRVREWTKESLRVAGKTDVLIGIPWYDQTRAHHPEVENIGSGIEGVMAALGDLEETPRNFTGIAIQGLDELTDREWRFIRETWYQPNRDKFRDR